MKKERFYKKKNENLFSLPQFQKEKFVFSFTVYPFPFLMFFINEQKFYENVYVGWYKLEKTYVISN